MTTGPTPAPERTAPPRRLRYVLALLLLFVVPVILWRVLSPRAPRSAAAPATQSLAADAEMLAASPGKWQSEVVKITTRDGSVNDRILQIEFGRSERSGQTNAPDAQARLSTSSLTKGIPHIAEVSSSLGDGRFRDVRLRETNGVRTITFTRAVDEDDRNPVKTQRIYDRFYSVSFPYELKNNVLTLKGFPTTNKLKWGVSEFTVATDEIKFKVTP